MTLSDVLTCLSLCYLDNVLCFRKCVNLSHGLFSHTIDNFEVLAEVPRTLVSAMAVDKLDAQIYNSFLFYILCILHFYCFIITTPICG